MSESLDTLPDAACAAVVEIRGALRTHRAMILHADKSPVPILLALGSLMNAGIVAVKPRPDLGERIVEFYQVSPTAGYPASA